MDGMHISLGAHGGPAPEECENGEDSEEQLLWDQDRLWKAHACPPSRRATTALLHIDMAAAGVLYRKDNDILRKRM